MIGIQQNLVPLRDVCLRTHHVFAVEPGGGGGKPQLLCHGPGKRDTLNLAGTLKDSACVTSANILLAKAIYTAKPSSREEIQSFFFNVFLNFFYF